jgi:hypothetical protein
MIAYLHAGGGGGLQTSGGGGATNVMSITEAGMHADCWIKRSPPSFRYRVACASRRPRSRPHVATPRRAGTPSGPGLGREVSKADGFTAWTRTKRRMDGNEVAALRRGLPPLLLCHAPRKRGIQQSRTVLRLLDRPLSRAMTKSMTKEKSSRFRGATLASVHHGDNLKAPGRHAGSRDRRVTERTIRVGSQSSPRSAPPRARPTVWRRSGGGTCG